MSDAPNWHPATRWVFWLATGVPIIAWLILLVVPVLVFRLVRARRAEIWFARWLEDFRLWYQERLPKGFSE